MVVVVVGSGKCFEKFVFFSLNSAVHYVCITQFSSEKCGRNHTMPPTFEDGGRHAPPGSTVPIYNLDVSCRPLRFLMDRAICLSIGI